MDLGLLGEILEQYYYFICSIPEFSNKVGEYLKDSKDVIIALLAIIFAIYIPLVIKYYDLIDNSTYKKLDLEIFKKRFFNLPKSFFYSVAITVLMFFGWNENTILFILPFIIFFLFLIISRLLDLSKFINAFLSDKLFDERLEYLSKQEFNDEILIYFNEFFKDKIIFTNYQETQKLFEIFFEKIHGKINKHKKGDWETEELIRKLLFSYNKLEDNSHILNSFNYQDFKLLLKTYKTDNENENSHLSGDIMKTIILKMEKVSGDTYWVLRHLKDFLKKENNNFRFKFLSHFHSSIFNSKIILEDSEFMKHYGKEIFNKYNNILGKLQKGIFQKLINLLWEKEGDYNHGYDNILQYWLLDFEPILFTELLYLYFIGYGENKALSIIETKGAFGGIGRLMETGPGEKTFEEQERELYKNTIENFYETFKNNRPNFDELISQFQKLEKNEKLSEKDILKSQHYIKLLVELKEKNKKDEK